MRPINRKRDNREETPRDKILSTVKCRFTVLLLIVYMKAAPEFFLGE